MLRKLLLIFLFLVSGPCFSSVEMKPKEIVEFFYATDLRAIKKLVVDTDETEIEKYRNAISDDMRHLYAESVAAMKACLATTKPDDKPYMLEFFLSTLHPDFYDKFVVKEFQKDEFKAIYQVELGNSEYPGSPMSTMVHLGHIDLKWKIIDIKSSDGSSLVEILKDYIALSRSECKP